MEDFNPRGRKDLDSKSFQKPNSFPCKIYIYYTTTPRLFPPNNHLHTIFHPFLPKNRCESPGKSMGTYGSHQLKSYSRPKKVPFSSSLNPSLVCPPQPELKLLFPLLFRRNALPARINYLIKPHIHILRPNRKQTFFIKQNSIPFSVKNRMKRS